MLWYQFAYLHSTNDEITVNVQKGYNMYGSRLKNYSRKVKYKKKPTFTKMTEYLRLCVQALIAYKLIFKEYSYLD